MTISWHSAFIIIDFLWIFNNSHQIIHKQYLIVSIQTHSVVHFRNGKNE
jgi:hypothetical protein